MATKSAIDYRIPLATGLVLYGIGLLAEDVFSVLSHGGGTVLAVIASGLVLWGVILGRPHFATFFDERFLLHRLKSTRFAMVVGLITMIGWFAYDAVAQQVYHWHLVVIAGIIVASKVGALAYYRLTE